MKWEKTMPYVAMGILFIADLLLMSEFEEEEYVKHRVKKQKKLLRALEEDENETKPKKIKKIRRI